MDNNLDEEVGFVAGTLVHTEKGLVPIEKIKVGDMVLSRPEIEVGKSCFKAVKRIFDFADKKVWFVGVTNLEIINSIQNGQGKAKFVSDYIVATPNHPFWVVGRLGEDYDRDLHDQEVIFFPKGYWSRLDRLDIGQLLLLANGTYVSIYSIQPVLQMIDDRLGFIQGYSSQDWREDKAGSYVEFNDSGVILHEKINSRLFNDYNGEAPVKKVKVYNIEVSDCNNYCVGKGGVWVHNTSSKDENNFTVKMLSL